MLGIILGGMTIALGLKGFRASGIPLTRRRNIHGKPARIIGVCCIVLGLGFVADGMFSGFKMWGLIASVLRVLTSPNGREPVGDEAIAALGRHDSDAAPPVHDDSINEDPVAGERIARLDEVSRLSCHSIVRWLKPATGADSGVFEAGQTKSKSDHGPDPHRWVAAAALGARPLVGPTISPETRSMALEDIDVGQRWPRRLEGGASADRVRADSMRDPAPSRSRETHRPGGSRSGTDFATPEGGLIPPTRSVPVGSTSPGPPGRGARTAPESQDMPPFPGTAPWAPPIPQLLPGLVGHFPRPYPLVAAPPGLDPIRDLSDPDPSVRRRAVWFLGHSGPHRDATISKVVEAMRSDKDEQVRIAALMALAEMGPDAQVAVPALIERLRDERTVGLARTALMRIGVPTDPEALEALNKALDDEDPAVRTTAQIVFRLGQRLEPWHRWYPLPRQPESAP